MKSSEAGIPFAPRAALLLAGWEPLCRDAVLRRRWGDHGAFGGPRALRAAAPSCPSASMVRGSAFRVCWDCWITLPSRRRSSSRPTSRSIIRRMVEADRSARARDRPARVSARKARSPDGGAGGGDSSSQHRDAQPDIRVSPGGISRAMVRDKSVDARRSSCAME